MNREFLVIMLIAGTLGAAGGWFFTGMLLDEIYKIHMTLGWLPVVVCALIVFITGMITTSATIRKAAKTSPVKTLRSE
jgi:ABC-type antimicrobial peptide transport system permease subunit